MNRVLIAGLPGSGKTTLARTLEQRLTLPRHELDALHHGPGWVKRPEFEADVEALAAQERWVTEAQYSSLLGDLLWQRADTLIWLDLPRMTVMSQVLRRSVIRAVTRRELWNGNRESFRGWLDPGHPVRAAWSHHARRRITTAERLAAHPHLTLVRLASAPEVRQWSASPGVGARD